ncbi:MAG: Holliday junction resolvase RuvX [Candidatus Omnitrophica bacterium]|nr:Holliday junction resolvase RuvX [Candidatus Omnitrophota bacterium]
MRIVGLDVGKRRIGVAISDEMEVCASTLKVVELRPGKEENLEWLKEIVSEYDVKEIVVGLPINLNGKLGSSAEEVLKYVEKIQKEIAIPVKTWDERLTTVQSERVLLEADLSRKKRKKLIDKLSAQIILQSYLYHRSRLRQN